jgi:mRNA-degrading endonuclease RelE of RelBE toxin-antitoxin system
MNYRFRAAKSFWRSWSRLSADQQQAARKAFQVFKQNPFDPRLRAHKIHRLLGSQD